MSGAVDMIGFVRFFGILSLLTFLIFCFTYVGFVFWNKDLKSNYGLKKESLHKGFLEDAQKKKGECVFFSLPVDYVSELHVNLVGEDLFIEQHADLEKIQVEIFYAPVAIGQTYVKVDYQLLSQGDRASLVCDKSLWRNWRPNKNTQKLMVGYVRIKIPTSLDNLKIVNIYGKTSVCGNYKQFNFLSCAGDLFFQGSIATAKLETFKGLLRLIGEKLKEESFRNLSLRSIKGKLIGDGTIKQLNVYGLWTSLYWQGVCEGLHVKTLYLDSQFLLKEVTKGLWDVSSFTGRIFLELPKECVREIGECLWKKKYLLATCLELVLPLSFTKFECKV